MKSLEVIIDWKAYFKRFCQVHGEPVKHANRLLFPDGYSYGIDIRYMGPEWEPPQDELSLVKHKATYWELRRRELWMKRGRIMAQRDYYERLSHCRSVPLQQKRTIEIMDEDGKKLRQVETVDMIFTRSPETGEIEDDFFTPLINDLSRQIDECSTELEKLGRQWPSEQTATA